jgi:hypothetical protein
LDYWQTSTIEPVIPTVIQPILNQAQASLFRGQINACISLYTNNTFKPTPILQDHSNKQNDEPKDIIKTKRKYTKRKPVEMQQQIIKKQKDDDEIIEIGSTTRTTKYQGPILVESWKLNSTEWLSNGHIDKYLQLMTKNIYSTYISGLFNPEIFLNYASWNEEIEFPIKFNQNGSL